MLIDTENLLTVSQFAKALGLTVSGVYKQIKTGNILPEDVVKICGIKFIKKKL